MRAPTPFAMMHWAKRRAERARFSLGASGISVPPDEELARLVGRDEPDADPFSSRGNYWGSPDLRDAIAAANGVAAESVLVSSGTSLANYTALTALAGPGDRVLVERPSYPSLEEIPRFHGATVEPLPRRPENRWQPSLDEIRTLAGPGGDPVRAVVLTRLHNPSGVDMSTDFLEGLAKLAERFDFHVLLDEVYLDFVEAAPGHRFSPRFVSTGSLTKVHGFGGLRVGWVIGDPEALRPMKELSFYLAVNGATWSESAAGRVFRHRDRVLARSRGIAARGLAIVSDWIEARSDVSWTRPDGGVSAFLKLARVADTAGFAERLFERESVAVAEGEHFGMPGWIRISFGLPEDPLREALRRLGRALDAE